MKQIKLNYLFAVLTLVTVLASCRKDKIVPDTTVPNADIYVLNQGGIGKNNSTLTFYNYAASALIPDQFFAANGAKLGDTGNDAVISGSKIYIAVNYSDVVTIAKAKDAKFIKQINLYQPRSIVAYKGNVFVTSYSNTVSVIDTLTQTITKTINVGRSPEQMVISNGKLYVANSGGLDYPNFDNTVSVIDLTTLIETKKITVIANPVTITADGYGNVYVMSIGDYGATAGGLTVINSATDVVRSTANPALFYNIPIATYGDFLYYPTADKKIAVYNTKSQSIVAANFIADGTVISEPYAITTDPKTGEVFIADAKDYASNGTVTAFDKFGKKEYVITAGINPGKIILLGR